MKKLLSILLIQSVLITSVLANEVKTINISNDSWKISTNWISIKINKSNTEDENKEITRKELFNFYANYFKSVIPESYKYIKLEYTDVLEWTEVYDSLQILVYYNLLENKKSRVYPLSGLSAYGLYSLSERILWLELLKLKDKEELQLNYANQNDLKFINQAFQDKLKILNVWSDSKSITIKKEIFQDVYNVLSEEHYQKDEFSETQLLDRAIQWLTEATLDKHTTYFPPTQNKNFQSSLSWEFEWIWAYVEMVKPGIFMVISPIKNAPAYNAWIKWGDQIIKVDDKEVLAENSSEEVISWIKWKKWTTVLITIKRADQILEFNVIRDTIVIDDITTEVISSDTFLISISSFWQNVSENFKEALVELSEQKRIKKVIIDLRNNGGWYLDQVADMLSYIVPKWKNTAVIKTLNWDTSYKSDWYELVNFNDYRIIILQNWSTASASEILAGTIKDYFPDTTLLGEQSYGKWSVQRLKQYDDGSLLKYTIAKWYTGWNEISIDGIWLTPDILLEFDTEDYQEYNNDNQLNKAIKLK